MARRALGAACLAAVLALAGPRPVRAQLLSPGRLAAPHSELEGIRNCTSCHQLGKSGVSADRCLACHETIGRRMRAGSGYHAQFEDRACSECHQDHLGEDFALVRFDASSFEHDEAGYSLELGHADLGCRECHSPTHVRDSLVIALKGKAGALERTYLGLPTDCSGCHADESPHGEQFAARGCAECHDSGRWDAPTAFDHSVTSFPLDGLHADVRCAQCHDSGPSARYRLPGAQSCDTCHDDPHREAMEGSCASCHTTGGWNSLRRASIDGLFDHARTRFALRGAHATADCVACHRTGSPPPATDIVRIAYQPGTSNRTFPLPVSASCASCHVDRHAFSESTGRWAGCADCHSELVWTPSAFGLARHAGSSFPLTGAHTTTPCVACHEDLLQGHQRFRVAIAGRRCADCHAADDPHENRYARLACESCHVTETFDDVAFDHALASTGADRCVGCHAPDDPHAGQFEGRACSSCHGTSTFAIPAFDHAATRFPLDGAHDGSACTSCHRTASTVRGPVVRYRPLGTACADCHGGTDAQ